MATHNLGWSRFSESAALGCSVLALAFFAAGGLGAQSEPNDSDSRWRTILVPDSDFYPANVADPHRCGMGAQLMTVDRSDIADTGESRFVLRLGGRFGLFRLQSAESEHRGWQLGIEAGFAGQFDGNNQTDNIGWDGYYGLIVSRGVGPKLAWKFGFMHTSAHVGDELAERTGRERIGYTREELQVGASWELNPRWRTYGELGWAYKRRSELQEEGRVQWGLVYEGPNRFFSSQVGWYVASDLSATEERDWRLDSSIQIGLRAKRALRTWRTGFELIDGRPAMGEFFRVTERALSLGLWLDL